MATTEDDEKTYEYFLKPGMEHNVIIRGERILLKGDDGDSASLTEAQAAAFTPKFLPKGTKPAPVELEAEPEAKPEAKPEVVEPLEPVLEVVEAQAAAPIAPEAAKK